MTIKIKELNIKKDEFEKVRGGSGWMVFSPTKLDGKIKVQLSEGIVTGSGEIDLFGISEKLRNKLYDVLSEIENELNGVTIKTNTGGKLVSVHNGETVLASDGVGNIHIKGDDTEEANRQAEIEKEMEHLTNIFKVNLNGFDTKGKTVNEVMEQLAKNIRKSGLKF